MDGFDLAVDEQCAQYDGCAEPTPFVETDRAALHVEYELTTDRFRADSRRAGDRRRPAIPRGGKPGFTRLPSGKCATVSRFGHNGESSRHAAFGTLPGPIGGLGQWRTRAQWARSTRRPTRTNCRYDARGVARWSSSG
ncbi:endo alpha-1,4 polygalactosaminidase [Streptomyces sp. NPDC018964]|uniref:endo alpha-1,4 polygalactosaminidase n=1 Tax=unclassified Streptomyces TaxID=2593676 RepID=UPI0037AEB175